MRINPNIEIKNKKGKIMHRAKTQRRKEKQNQDFVALSCENPFQAPGQNNLLVLSRVAGNEPWFHLRLCVFAREPCFYGEAKGLCPGPEDPAFQD